MAEEENMSKLLSYIPYDLFIEIGGGPDHEISTFQNNFCIFALFLFTSVDKLVVASNCPGISYINTVEKKILVLNIGLANITLQMKPCQWLLYEVLANTFLMKKVQTAASEYKNKLPTDIYVVRRR